MYNLKGSKRLLALFFSFYFFLYAITPLSFSFDGDDAVTPSLNNLLYSLKSFNLYLLEVIGSAVLDSSDAYAEDPPSSFILLKKKRTILPKLDFNIFLLTLNFSLPDDKIRLNSSAISAQVIEVRAKVHKGFLPSFSGLSPPSV